MGEGRCVSGETQEKPWGTEEREYQGFCLYVLILFLLGKLNNHIRTNGTGPLSYTKINSKWTIDSNTE